MIHEHTIKELSSQDRIAGCYSKGTAIIDHGSLTVLLNGDQLLFT